MAPDFSEILWEGAPLYLGELLIDKIEMTLLSENTFIGIFILIIKRLWMSTFLGLLPDRPEILHD